MLTILSMLALAAAPQQEVDPVGSLQTLAVPSTPGVGPVVIDVTLDGKQVSLELERHSIRAGDFKVYASRPDGSLVQLPAPTPATWRGRVHGLRDADVTATIDEHGLTAIVADYTGDRQWQIQPAAGHPAGVYSVAKPEDLIVPPAICGVPNTPQNAQTTTSGGARGTGLQLCELAIDCDYEFYQDNGSSVTGAINDAERILNRVDNIYTRDVDVTFQITTIIVRTNNNDPYTTNVSGDLLDEFRVHWSNNMGFVRRDLAHLFTGKSIQGNVIGVAYLAQVCSTGAGYGFTERFTANVTSRTGVCAHEIGHNFSAGHCDGNGDCRIMCSGLGGCQGDITQFGTASANTISNYAISRGCLLDLATAPALPIFEPVASTSINTDLWISRQSVPASTGASNEPSAPYSFQLAAANAEEGGDDFIISNRFDFSALSDVNVSFYTQARGVNAGNALRVDYVNSMNDWAQLTRIVSSGTTENSFTQHVHALPSDALHDEFQLRFIAEVDGSSEAWYVDDIEITDQFCGQIYQYCIANANSTGNVGDLTTLGSTSLAANDLLFFATLVPANQFGLLVYGDQEVLSPLSDGFLCVSGTPLFRYQLALIDSFGVAGIAFDNTALPTGSVINPGDVLKFQFWHRDSTPNGANLTLPISVEFCP